MIRDLFTADSLVLYGMMHGGAGGVLLLFLPDWWPSSLVLGVVGAVCMVAAMILGEGK